MEIFGKPPEKILDGEGRSSNNGIVLPCLLFLFLLFAINIMSDQQVPVPARACPCCAFAPGDLFLPGTPKNDNESGESQYPPDDGMPTPQQALQHLAGMTLVDTHCHAHLERNLHETYQYDDATLLTLPRVISLSCSVEPSDWQACLDYAAQSTAILPALGVHPWYLENLPENYLEQLEGLLKQHKHAMVGEIGLCKVAKFVRTYPEGKTAALELQRRVFKEQMELAAKYQRPVSVHCVNQHGVLMKVLEELPKLPPTIGMHSFTGTAQQVQQLLKFDQQHPSTQIFFGFSHIVNYEMCSSDKSRRQGHEAIRAVPRNRLLAESDVHHALDVAMGTAGAIAHLAYALEQPPEQVAQLTLENGLEFLRSACGDR
jgi:TatD DNase family protein